MFLPSNNGLFIRMKIWPVNRRFLKLVYRYPAINHFLTPVFAGHGIKSLLFLFDTTVADYRRGHFSNSMGKSPGI
jgi:hypothetical protein